MTVAFKLPQPDSADPDDIDFISRLEVRDDDDDDPVLLWPDGTEVDTWRDDGNYPHSERMKRDEYEKQKRKLQIELVKLQNWVKDTGQRIVIVF
ncbi:MAG: polyphosphate kinase 2, partial [Nocardiopsaceae bacterium]|nr:polyphosphate kinase 2 [Nocardiopsaceae bacterium]